MKLGKWFSIVGLICILSIQAFCVERSSKWISVRKHFLLTHSSCTVCGSIKKIEVHHCIPFHINPILELDENNLITLCESKSKNGLNCHLTIGHGGNYKDYNPDIRKDAAHFHDLFFIWQDTVPVVITSSSSFVISTSTK